MFHRNRRAASLEAFLEGAVPIKDILWGRDPHPSPAHDERGIPRHGPVVLLDLAGHPQLSITDLGRVYRTDMPGGEGPLAFAWEFWVEPAHERAKLRLSYAVPVAVEFAIVFSCTEHWAVLRWMAENGGMVKLADEAEGPLSEEDEETPRSALLVQMGRADELAIFLRGIKIAEAEARKGKRLTGYEVVMTALEGRRFLSFAELASVLNTWGGIPHQGKESLLITTSDTHQRIPLRGISRPFKLVVEQVTKNKQVAVVRLDGLPHLIRRDWTLEQEEAEAEETSGGKRRLPHQSREAFTADTIPVARIVEARDSASSADEALHGNRPIALLDLSEHPEVNLRDLARKRVFAREAATTYDWAVGQGANDVLVRLTCTYYAPTREQFAILFSYRAHQLFLRWVMEHENEVPVADAQWREEPGAEEAVVLYAPNPDLPMSLSIMLMHQILTREERVPDVKEMAQLLFAVKRSRSLSELADFASTALRMPVRGEEEQMIANATAGPNAWMIAQQLSREFRILLLEMLTLEGMSSGMYQGEAHLFTEDWLAEQQ